MSHIPKSYLGQPAEKSYHVQYAEIGAADRPPRRRNWKPFATRLPYLFSLVILLMLAVVALEILIQKSVPVSRSSDSSPSPEASQSTDNQNVAKRQVSTSAAAATTSTRPPSTTIVETKTVTDPNKLLQLTTTTTQIPPTTTTRPPTTTIVDTKTVTDPNKLLQLTTTTTQPPATTTTRPPPTTTAEKTVTNPGQMLQLTTTPTAGLDTNTSPIQTDTGALLQLTTTSKPQPTDPKSLLQLQTTSTPDGHSVPSTNSLLQLSATTTIVTGVPNANSLLQLSTTTTVVTGVPGTKSLLQLSTTTTVITGVPTTKSLLQLSSSTNPVTYSLVTNTNNLLQLSSSSTAGLNKGQSTTTPGIAFTKTDSSDLLQLNPTTTKDSGSGSGTTRSAADTQTNSSKFLVLGSSTTFTDPSKSGTKTVGVSGTISKGLFVTATPSAARPQSLLSIHGNTQTAGQTPTTTEDTTKPTTISLLQKALDADRLDLRVEGILTYYTYFAVVYLPSIIAVMLREIWNLTASGLKLMEPFYQLSTPGGTTAKESLLADYLGSTTSLYSLTSAFKGNKKMIVITLVNLIMNLLAPVATEAMTAVPNWVMDNGELVPRTAYWGSSAMMIRVLQSMLSCAAFSILLLAFFDWKRRSSLSANPSKIATMASLLGTPNVVHDLNSLPPNASDEDLVQSLAYRGFMIADYRDKHGNYCCGLLRAGETVPQGLHRLPLEDFAGPMSYGAVPAFDRHGTRPAGRTILQLVFDVFFLVWISALLGTIVAYWLDHSASSFNEFFNSAKFGPRFILSLGASIATSTFQAFEREVRLMTPYRVLAKGYAPASRTVLRSVDGTAVSSVFQSIRHGAWFCLFIAFVTVLGDILIITVAGIPYTGSSVKEFMDACFFTSMIISGLMILCTLLVFMWRRMNKKLKIPQEPNEILVRVWASLCNPGNQLRASLGDCGRMSAGDLKHRLKYEGGSYWAGWIKDQHGRNLWCVDKEPEHTQAEFR